MFWMALFLQGPETKGRAFVIHIPFEIGSALKEAPRIHLASLPRHVEIKNDFLLLGRPLPIPPVNSSWTSFNIRSIYSPRIWSADCRHIPHFFGKYLSHPAAWFRQWSIAGGWRWRQWREFSAGALVSSKNWMPQERFERTPGGPKPPSWRLKNW